VTLCINWLKQMPFQLTIQDTVRWSWFSSSARSHSKLGFFWNSRKS